MNAKSKNRNPSALSFSVLKLTQSVCLLAILLSKPALSFQVSDPIEDPLLTRPPVLSSGPTLPDQSLITCPASSNLQQALGLSDVIDIALCHNPKIKQAWAGIKIQASTVGQARASYLPKINATYSPQQTQSNYPEYSAANSNTTGHMSYASFTWRLFDFGGRDANRISANLLLEAALSTHDASIQKAMAGVIGSYFDVLTADATRQAKSQSAKFAKESLESTLRRERKGVSDKSDTLQAQTALSKAELSSARAEGNYRKALASLIFSMGLPTETKLTLKAPQDSIRQQGLKDLDAWLEQAQMEHPAIKTARAQWLSSKEKITSARSEGLPTIDFVANFYQNGYPNQGLQPTQSNTSTVGIVLNIPIFDGFERTYKIREAEARAEQSLAQMEETKQQILTEIVKSHADAVSSLTNLESSEKLLEASKKAVDSSVKRYSNGEGSILELLSTQTALAEAQQERIRCISEWRSSRLRLLADSASLGRNFYQANN